MRRNSALAGALAAAALAAACGRPEPPAPADPARGVTLAAPAASVVSPLSAQATSYTNEMQAQNLRDQAAELGISKFAKPSSQESESDAPPQPISYEQAIARTRATARQAEAQRHAIERDKEKTVVLPSGTPGLIPGRKEGAPLESPPDGSGPKDPDAK